MFKIGKSFIFALGRIQFQARNTINPSSAEATYVKSTRMQRFLKTIQTLPCWYSFESFRWVLSDEYQYARVSGIF